MQHTRREFLQLAGIGGVVFASGLASRASSTRAQADDFYFVQLSDTHWGFDGPSVNPDSRGTLKKAIAAVNALEERPDFVVFTGDLTHTTDDAAERRMRMREFRDIAGGLNAKQVYYLAGEHDAAADRGEAYQENFGALHYAFDHKGVHFIALDNVSDPSAIVGDAQLAWLRADLAKRRKSDPIVVLTHRPLFDLYPSWDWATRDAQGVIDALTPFDNVTIFYGHIHQVNHHMSGHIGQHSAASLMFPLPPPGSVAKKAPVPWNVAMPYQGLGIRSVDVERAATRLEPHDLPLVAPVSERVVKVSAHRYGYVPDTITLKRVVPVVFEVTSADVKHGSAFPISEYDRTWLRARPYGCASRPKGRVASRSCATCTAVRDTRTCPAPSSSSTERIGDSLAPRSLVY